MPTVMIYSSNASFRQRVMMAVGSTPDPTAPTVSWVEAADAPTVSQHGGAADLVILDGEAHPAGGLGISRQMKGELTDCPPTIVVIARADDAWLGTWSLADAVLALPIDPVSLTATVSRLLAEHAARLPVPVRRGRFGNARS